MTEEFHAYLRCGILAHGFIRLTCDACHHDTLVAFSCKRRGICPACGTRRMNEAAAYLVDEIIPRVPVRQWVLSFPIPLRSLFAVHPERLTPVLALVQRAIGTHLIMQTRIRRTQAATGAVTLIQRFGSAANLNIHLHGLWLDGVYQTPAEVSEGEPVFHEAPPPTPAQLQVLLDKIIKRILRLLTKTGHLIKAEEGTVCLADTDPDNALAPLQAAATWRIAHGPRAGQKVLRLYQGQAATCTHSHDALCVNAHEPRPPPLAPARQEELFADAAAAWSAPSDGKKQCRENRSACADAAQEIADQVIRLNASRRAAFACCETLASHGLRLTGCTVVDTLRLVQKGWFQIPDPLPRIDFQLPYMRP